MLSSIARRAEYPARARPLACKRVDMHGGSGRVILFSDIAYIYPDDDGERAEREVGVRAGVRVDAARYYTTPHTPETGKPVYSACAVAQPPDALRPPHLVRRPRVQMWQVATARVQEAALATGARRREGTEWGVLQ